MKRVWHIARRVLIVTAVVIGLLLGGAVAFAHTDYANRKLREEVVRLLREDFGLEASFEQVELDILPPRIHVMRTEVIGSDDRPLLEVDRITVALAPAALLQGKIEVSEITLEEPEVNLIIEDRRVVNLPELRRNRRSSDGGQPISDLGVLAGRVNLEIRDAPGGPVRVRLADTNADLAFTSEGTTDVRLLIAGGSVEQEDRRHPIELIQGRVMLRDDQMLLREVRVRIGDLRLEVPSATAGTSAPFDIDGHAELSLPLELVRDLPVRAPPLQGEVAVSADVTRRGGRLEIGGDLSIAGLIVGPEFIGRSERTYGPHPLGDIDARFRYTPERIAVSEVTIDRPAEGDGRLIARDLTVELRREGVPIRAQVEFGGVELAHILIDAGLSASRVRGKIFGDATLEGNLRGGFRLRFRPVDLRMRDFATLTASVLKEDKDLVLAIADADVRGEVVVEGAGVRLNDMMVTFGRSAVGLHAFLGIRSPRTWWLRASTPEGAELHAEEVGPIAGLFMGGRGSVSAHIHGTYGDPTVEGRLDLRDFQLGSVPFGHVQGSLRYRQMVIHLPLVRGERGRSSYRFVDGRVDFRGGLRLDGVAELDRLYLSDAMDIFGVEGASRGAEGVFRGRAEVRYTSRGDQWLVDVAGDLTEATYAGYSVGRGEVNASYDTGDITVRRVTLRRAGGEARISGELSRQGELDMAVELSRVPIRVIEPLPEVLRTIEGDARGRVRIRGTTDFPRAAGMVELSPLIFRGTRYMPSRLHFELEGDELRVQGGLGGRMVQLEELRIRLSQPYPLWVRGEVRRLRLAELLGPGVLPEGLRVRLDASLDGGVEVGRLISGQARTTVRTSEGEVTIWGARQRDLGLSGWARVGVVEVEHPAFDVRNAEPVTLDLVDDRISFRRPTAFTVSAPTLEGSTEVTLGGWASPDGLGLELSGELDLAFVPALIEHVSVISGRLSVEQVRISGPLSQPAIMGAASFAIDRLVLDGLESYPATALSGELRFSRNVVLLENVEARILGGEIDGGGRVILSGLSLGAYHLRATVQDATLSLGTRSSAVINGTVTLDSPPSEDELPVVGGQMEVVRLRYQEPIELASDLGELSLTRRTEVQTYDRARDSFRLNLRLTGSDNLRLENNLARATLIIDDTAQPFRVIGTNQYQTAQGTVRIEPHGVLTFRDTQFDVDRGILVFTDPFELNPTIDFVATAVRRDWVITLRITGTFDEPRISLTSDPALAEADITLLLTVGLTREETEQMGYLSAASSAIPELLWSLSGVDEEVTRLLAMGGDRPVFDEFRITTDYSQRTGRPEPRIRVGRRLTDSIRLGASAGLAETRDFEANVEVDLPMVSEGLSFEAGYENDSDLNMGNIGGDLRWRQEF